MCLAQLCPAEINWDSRGAVVSFNDAIAEPSGCLSTFTEYMKQGSIVMPRLLDLEFVIII